MGGVEGKTLLWGLVSARGTAPGVAYSMSCSEDCRHHRRVVWPWGFGVERGSWEERRKGAHLSVAMPIHILPQYSTSDPSLNLPAVTPHS